MDTNDIVEIQQLMALYGHAVDAPDQALLPEVFTEDAVFDAQSTGWGILRGRDAIADWFALGKPPHPPSHNVMDIYVREENGETRVHSKWLTIDRRSNEVVSGDYNDIVVKTVYGWRIRYRTFVIRHPIDYKGQTPVART